MRIPKLKKIQTKVLPLEQNFAKTYVDDNGVCRLGQTVLEHALTSGLVARELWQWWPDALQKKWFPDGLDFLVSEHDVGKMTPAFQEKLRRATSDYFPNSIPELATADPSLEKRWGGHSGASLLTVTALTHDARVPLILGLHHGRRPKTGMLRAADDVLGGKAWQEQRELLTQKLKAFFNAEFPVVKSDLQAKVLAGFTTVADWIGSNDALLQGKVCDAAAARRAVMSAGFYRPRVKQKLNFADIFGFTPNDAQKALAVKCSGPGVYILETVMGAGKTEAALYAAYRLLAQGQATGLYFALPTQTTSNAVYTRVNSFLDKILEDDDAAKRALLVHGKAALVMQEMGEEAAPGGGWFAPRKRSILAPFGVGTIDQALMSVMGVKHSSVRTLGLLGKVVILDEVHSYDMYTGTIVDALVKELRELGCTVIVLSATLTQQRRGMLADQPSRAEAYPLLTAVDQKGELAEIPIEAPSAKKVELSYASDDSIVLKQVIERAKGGQQVLWIENTVNEAQKLHERLSEALSGTTVELGIIHSRFTVADREVNEHRWIDVLGKKSTTRAQRGRVLVGTQVLEQSLDIDADFLVTRLCPTDMLLQRMGRLWRHAVTERPGGARCEACVICPDENLMKKDPKKAFGASAHVYASYVLCRTLESLAGRASITLPTDIRQIMEDTYRERPESGVLSDLLNELEEGSGSTVGRRALRQLAQLTLTDAFGTIDDNDESNLATRYCQMPTVDVLLLRRILNRDGKTEIEFLSGKKLDLPDGTGLSYSQKVSTALILMKNCVRTPIYLAPTADEQRSLSWLAPYLFVAAHDSMRIRVGLVDDDGSVYHMDGTPALPNRRVFYDKSGYRCLNPDE